jgi:single-stranded-DNA-specific exonuclease
MQQGRWTIAPCSHAEAASLARAVGVSEITASVLVRRGCRDPREARSFLEGEQPLHDPLLLGAMAEACEAIRRAVADGKRICVHGDYDADGICATALAIVILRELGADAHWHLPSRFDEGYGLSRETLARLESGGCGLVLTVDCGITAVDEVAEARARGLEVVVTDHHRPGDRLPDCPVVATCASRYPFSELSGTGVVFKLGQALLGGESPALRRHLDLVGLATIADLVPLVGENRSLAIAGLRALARSSNPGLRALMRAARVDAARVDEYAVAFRLAPRINAAGRLGHPRAALDLLLTDDDETAAKLAGELEGLNAERQAVEEGIARAALAQVEAWPERHRARRGYVVAGEDWHAGVIGIVASRLVERFHRPVVLIAGGGREWKGSGRSIPAFDLHRALRSCSDHLERFGGHRAAAGLSVRPEEVDAFHEAFAAYADATLAEADLRPVTVVDAVLPPRTPLTLDLCAELARLAPFGLGNPDVTLLAESCELRELAPVGEGRHLRFRVRGRRREAGSAIAFGLGPQLDRFRGVGRYDVAFRLRANQWNGTVAPQLVVDRIFETSERYEELRARLEREWRDGEPGWSVEAREIFTELGLTNGGERSLLESERFRTLLDAPPLARAA